MLKNNKKDIIINKKKNVNIHKKLLFNAKMLHMCKYVHLHNLNLYKYFKLTHWVHVINAVFLLTVHFERSSYCYLNNWCLTNVFFYYKFLGEIIFLSRHILILPFFLHSKKQGFDYDHIHVRQMFSLFFPLR